MKVDKLIRASLKLVGAIESNGNPEPEEQQDALDALNQTLNWLSSQRLGVHRLIKESFTLVPGTGTYTYGATGDFDSARPVRIVSAYVRDSDYDYPVDVRADADLAEVGDKSFQGMPEMLALNGTYPLATVSLFPVPDQAYALHVDAWKPLPQLTDVEAELNLPPEYETPLVYLLAARLSTEYKGTDPGLFQLADKYLKDLKRLHAQPVPQVRTDPFSGKRFDILRGI